MVKPSRAIRPTVSTSIARSATLIRSCSDSTVSSSATATADWATIGPGVDALVDEEQRAAGDLDAVGQRVGGPVHARERGAQRRVGVDEPAAERGEEVGADQLHEPRRDHQVRLGARRPTR